MKRVITAIASLAILALTLLTAPVSAAGGYEYTISGTTTSYADSLVISDFFVAGKTDDDIYGLTSLTGTISYSTADLTLINKTVVNTGWQITFTEKKAGTITFTAKASAQTGYIKASTEMFKLTFVVVNGEASTVSVTAKGLKGTVSYQKTVVVENPATPENPFANPTTTTEDATQDVTFDNVTQKVKIDKLTSTDAYLSAGGFEGTTIDPAFSKKTNSYTVTVPAEVLTLNPTMKAENPDAKVEIGQEVNNQILVNVTAADGKTTNTYLFTIKRNSSDATDPNASGSTTDVKGANGFDTGSLLTIGGIGLAGAAALALGIMLLYRGSHE